MGRFIDGRRRQFLGVILAAAVPTPEVGPFAQTDHWVNRYRCMRNGETPNASPDAGYQHVVASMMVTISHETGRRARFAAVTRTITTD